MSRFTVCWHNEADNELMEIWLSADISDHAAISGAAHEINKTLSSQDAEEAGTRVSPETLSLESRALLIHRSVTVPRDLRSLREGPIEVFFTVHPLDCQTRVLLVRLCAE